MPSFIRESPSGPELPSLSDTTNAIENVSSAAGDTFSDALDDLAEAITEAESVSFVEDFLGGVESGIGSSITGVFGDLGFSFFSTSASGAIVRAHDHEQYFGAYEIVAPSSATSSLLLSNAISPSAGVSLPSTRYRFIECLGTPDTADSPGAFGAYRYGLFNDGLSNAIYLEVDRASSNFWRLVGRILSTFNIVTSSIPYTPHALTRLRIERRASDGAWVGSVNGVAFGELTAAQVSSQRMVPGCQVASTAASAQSCALDRLSLSLDVL